MDIAFALRSCLCRGGVGHRIYELFGLRDSGLDDLGSRNRRICDLPEVLIESRLVAENPPPLARPVQLDV